MADQKLQSSVESTEVGAPERASSRKTFLNWALALLTVPLAIVVVVVALGGVMAMDSCAGQSCHGPGPVPFSILFYGGPIVSALAIVALFFTARRPWGIAVPLAALALQVIDLVVLFAWF